MAAYLLVDCKITDASRYEEHKGLAPPAAASGASLCLPVNLVVADCGSGRDCNRHDRQRRHGRAGAR